MDHTAVQSMMDKYPDQEVVKIFGACLLKLMERPQAATMGQGEGSSPGSSEEVAELRQELDKHVNEVSHQALSEGATETHPCRCGPCANDKKNALAESWNLGQKALLKQFDEAAVAENVEGARDVLVEAVKKHRNGNSDKSGAPEDALTTIIGH